MVKQKTTQLQSVPVLAMHGLPVNTESGLSPNGTLMVVCGLAKGKTAHLKISLKPLKRQSAGASRAPYNFDLTRYDFS